MYYKNLTTRHGFIMIETYLSLPKPQLPPYLLHVLFLLFESVILVIAHHT